MKHWRKIAVATIAAMSLLTAFSGGQASIAKADSDTPINHAVSVKNESQAHQAVTGKTFRIVYDNGSVFNIEYADANRLRWEGIEGPAKGESGSERYTIREISKGLYFIGWVEKDGLDVSQILDLNKMQAYSHITYNDDSNVEGRRAETYTAGTVTDITESVSKKMLEQQQQEERNKKIVTAFYEEAFNKKNINAVLSNVAEDYKQHNPAVADGRQAFISFLKGMYTEVPNSTFQVKRVMADGDYVTLHVHFKSSPVEKGEAIVDIFRLEKGKIVEHWDVIQSIPEQSANTNSMF